MKNMNEHPRTYGPNYQDHEFEQKLAGSLEQQAVEARTLGDKHGRRNKPGKDDKSLHPFIGGLVEGYKRLIKEVETHIFNGHNAEWIQNLIASAKEKRDKLKRMIIEQGDRVKDAVNEFRDLSPPYDPNRVRLWKLAVVLASCLEVILGFLALQGIGIPIILSFIAGLGLGAVVLGIAHTVPDMLRKIKNPRIRWITFVGTLIAVGILFFILGVLRSMYLNEDALLKIPPWVFAGVNLILFGSAALFAYFQFPTKEQRDEMQRYLEKKRKVDEETNRMTELEVQLATEERDIYEQVQVLLQRKAKAKSLKAEVTAHAREGIGLYKNENLLARRDDIVPPCFNNGSDIPGLDEPIDES